MAVLLVASSLMCLPATAQKGPGIPCAGCPEFEHPPYPEAGIWRNPEQSGTGFMLEVQNGHLAGFYYLFDEDGRAHWFMFVADLVESEAPEVAWEATTELEHFAGGACLNCPYQPPELIEPGGVIRFEFMQRNFGRFRVDDGESQNILPILHGVAGHAHFAPDTPYRVPNPEGFWSLTRKQSEYLSTAVRIGPFEPGEAGGIVATIHNGVDPSIPGIPPAPPPEVVGELRCGALDGIQGPICEIDVDSFSEIYRMPLGNLGGSRFDGESENGFGLEAHRLDYD